MKSFPKNKPVRLKGKAMEALRRERFYISGGWCEICGNVWAPWHEGELSHVIHRGMGGKNGPGDVIENVRWSCKKCHVKRHN